MRYESDDDRRARELAASYAYDASAANDPVLNQRIAEAQRASAAGEIDEADLISYEDLMARIRELGSRR